MLGASWVGSLASQGLEVQSRRGTGTLLWPYGLLACGVGHSYRGVRAGPSKAQGPGQEPQFPGSVRNVLLSSIQR